MTFIWPNLLLLLIVVPLLVWMYLRIQYRRKQAAARYSGLGLWQNASGRRAGFRRHLPPLLFLLGLTILIVSLARPQMQLSLPRVEGTVILAFDVSGSMSADDLKPNRIEAAKAAARDFIDKQPPSVQIGVVAFSDNGFSVQPPTNRPEDILAAINRLAPQRGTSLANGITASLNTIATHMGDKVIGDTEGEPAHLSDRGDQPTPTPTPVPKGIYKSAVIVLLTDGENNENPDPLEAAQAAADRGVRIYPIGIGSTSGAVLKLNGFSVHTRLDEALLQQISEITGGTYYTAENEQQLLSIYDNLNPQLLIKPQKTEATAIFAGASLLILLLGATLSLIWFSRIP